MSSRRLGTRALLALTAATVSATCLIAMPHAASGGNAANDSALSKISVDRGAVIKKLLAHQFHSLNAEMLAYEKWSALYLRFELPDPIIIQIAQQSAQELKAQGKGNW